MAEVLLDGVAELHYSYTATIYWKGEKGSYFTLKTDFSVPNVLVMIIPLLHFSNTARTQEKNIQPKTSKLQYRTQHPHIEIQNNHSTFISYSMLSLHSISED